MIRYSANITVMMAAARKAAKNIKRQIIMQEAKERTRVENPKLYKLERNASKRKT